MLDVRWTVDRQTDGRTDESTSNPSQRADHCIWPLEDQPQRGNAQARLNAKAASFSLAIVAKTGAKTGESRRHVIAGWLVCIVTHARPASWSAVRMMRDPLSVAVVTPCHAAAGPANRLMRCCVSAGADTRGAGDGEMMVVVVVVVVEVVEAVMGERECGNGSQGAHRTEAQARRGQRAGRWRKGTSLLGTRRAGHEPVSRHGAA
ncbi:hypothetical protein BC831DRAFT_244041 [Entophlyctis helioformis]|nr:hypothetical protein BC831DRAFT_244041 [Entophlyctis helioformis]